MAKMTVKTRLATEVTEGVLSVRRKVPTEHNEVIKVKFVIAVDFW